MNVDKRPMNIVLSKIKEKKKEQFIHLVSRELILCVTNVGISILDIYI
jgi:hypothetical protein